MSSLINPSPVRKPLYQTADDQYRAKVAEATAHYRTGASRKRFSDTTRRLMADNERRSQERRAADAAAAAGPQIISELAFQHYRDHRDSRPEITVAQWSSLFGAATPQLETRYQAEEAVRQARVVLAELGYVPKTHAQQRMERDEAGCGESADGYQD